MTSATCYIKEPFVFSIRTLNQLGVRNSSGVAGQQSNLVGKNDKSICLNHISNKCSEHVVVAKTYLFRANSVIFINDCNASHLCELVESALHIEITLTTREVFVGQKNLG
ncbi:hypothetical protein CI15_20415 [Paraburkholderia monticola]|uniref:Uncharacterized protein n=1 Tax=Paraburkholderia monticola TaxID=1399968 RepID=A0A149PKG7_9BURK|nr:hypothetical protein CI15_20415 [Paraburkholderia monticola]